jgi:hypothetical protein
MCAPEASLNATPPVKQFLPLTQNLSLFIVWRRNIKYKSHFSYTIENLQCSSSCFNRCKFISYLIQINGFCHFVLIAKRTTVQGKDLVISFTPLPYVSQKYIPQSEEFTDNKNIVISRCAPNPTLPRAAAMVTHPSSRLLLSVIIQQKIITTNLRHLSNRKSLQSNSYFHNLYDTKFVLISFHLYLDPISGLIRSGFRTEIYIHFFVM